mgnify:FL=1
MKSFSIIIPVYNVEQYLKKCLESVINQTYNNYEVIIVCDKCSDNSEKIVDYYVKKYKNFKKIYAENTGLGKARNLGVEEAAGDYILFLDSDDYYELELLKTLNKELKENPDLLRFQVQNIKNEQIIKYNETPFTIITGIEAFKKIIKYHYVENAWCYCYKKTFYQKNKFNFMEGCIAEDYGLTPLIIAKAKTIKSISYIGYNYVERENSLMTTKDYSKKIKKMDDMLLQANYLKKELESIKSNENFLTFINNSLIYYSTRLKYKDYKKYNKILKKSNCYVHLHGKTIKSKIRNFLIKSNAYIFYNYIVR